MSVVFVVVAIVVIKIRNIFAFLIYLLFVSSRCMVLCSCRCHICLYLRHISQLSTWHNKVLCMFEQNRNIFIWHFLLYTFVYVGLT